MPLDTLFTNPLPPIPPSRSILSRLTTPLAKRNRNLADFAIEPDHPWKSYGPGDLVKGSVILTVAKGFDVTHLVTCLHGYAKVYKNQIVPGEGTLGSGTIDFRGGNQGTEYRGNGLISLFQDEVVLCSEGFLKKGTYRFGFELEFPNQSLPSSIDFERGTVSYSISATLTRPANITPTVSVSRRVTFQDSIDVGNISVPKPRVISLEPIAKRGRVKAKARSTVSLEKGRDNTSSRMQVSRTNTDSSMSSNRPNSIIPPPTSPTPSDTTAASQNSASTQSFQLVNHAASGSETSRKDSEGRSSTATSTSGATITATTELQKQGALPGDTIPIKVSVQHNRPNVRGLVIVTLYRQGRIDLYPALQVSRGKNKKLEYEDVYPRSKTGLGGLYFSNGSPSSVFRKDLSQSTAMMIINPQTLMADVKTSIKVPEGAFPTMTNVPGSMLMFKYYVEIVVDLCGKLGETRFLPRLTSQEPTFTDGAENTSRHESDWANHILDTVQLRRTKSVVDITFPIIVGTTDSVRATPSWPEEPVAAERVADERDPASDFNEEEQGHYDENGNLYHYEGGYDGAYDQPPDGEPDTDHVRPATTLIPPPLDQDEPVDEKERLRRQEALLLPSQPPEEGESSSSAAALAPSAPYIDGESGLYGYRGPHDGETSPAIPHVGPSTMSARSFDTIVPETDSSALPPVFDGDQARSPQDDKHDMERQRLMAQASAPPVEDEADFTGPSNPPDQDFAPSAPVINEEEDYNSHTLHHNDHTGEHLPQYQR